MGWADRRRALVAAAALVLSACSARSTEPSSNEPVTYGSPGATLEGRPHGGGSTPSSTSTARATTSTFARLLPPPHSVYPDDDEIGAMALHYLRASPARRLVVEIDYVEGRRPDRDALDHLGSILRRECAKPRGVQIEVDDEIPSERSFYSFSAIDRLRARYRDRHSSGDTATMWMVFLNGKLSDEPSTLGVAFRASAIAIFKDQIDDAATAIVSAPAIERSVLTHEAGHLLALVNIGYRSRHDHEDSNHPKHSRYQTSVMYWAIEDFSIAAILRGGPPDDLDSFDRDDLAALRGSWSEPG